MRRVPVLFVFAAFMAACGCSKRVNVERPPACAAVSNAIEMIAATFAPSGDVRRVDVSSMTVEEFYKIVSKVSPRATLWMPGAQDWLIVGTEGAGFISLSASMDRFFAFDNVCSLPQLFASYVGTIEEVLPAFADLGWENVVAPANFVTREIPETPWLKADGLDEDIRRETLAEIRSMQVVRRVVLEGNQLAADAKTKEEEQKAIDCWARAALRNPQDPMVLERIERLNRNANGFLEVGKVLQAMKCYERIVLIQPSNAAAVHNFGMCLKKIGKLDLAEQVLKRAEDLSK